MRKEIIFAGEGGQGPLTAGKILANAIVLNGKYAIWVSEYGPEARGGTANCSVIISDEEIGSPLVDTPHCIIVMNQLSLTRFLQQAEAGCVVIINSSLVSLKSIGLKIPGVEFVEIDANTIAEDTGNPQAANLVMLGAYIAHSNVVPIAKALKGLEKWSRENEKESFLETNKKALLAGAQTEITS